MDLVCGENKGYTELNILIQRTPQEFMYHFRTF